VKTVTIFIADDHSILRDGLKLILSSEPNYDIVGESGDGLETVQMVEKTRPDVLILDISLPTMSGIEVTRHLKKYVPETRIIILSRHDKEDYVNQLLKFGIGGYILKEDAGDDVIRAIEEVIKGNMFLSPRIATSLVTDYMAAKKERRADMPQTPFGLLTPREREILKLIAEGNKSSEIGKTLRISPQTVKTHRANIMKKLNLHKTADLVHYAIKHGFIEI
jgi:DNA-binding NarL/FixJ family response regulator